MNKFSLYFCDFSAEEIAEITGGSVISRNSDRITSVSTDSRDVELGTLFVAIKGERFDGHDFITEVFASGAS